MAIDPSQIELTKEQKTRIAKLAERRGEDYSVVVDEWLASSMVDPELHCENGADQQSVYQKLKAIGAIGCIDGPGDLSTNPKHMEGFGVNASRQRSSD